MTVEIRREPADAVTRFSVVPVAFEVSSIFDIVETAGPLSLRERRIEHVFVKDYDSILENSPTSWPHRFSTDAWGVFSAQADGEWVGAAAVVLDAVSMIPENANPETALLWDLRVAPAQRGRGIGRALFSAVEQWVLASGKRDLLAETQNLNVPACRFYQRMGCVLSEVEYGAYPELPDEVKLVWCKHLSSPRVL